MVGLGVSLPPFVISSHISRIFLLERVEQPTRHLTDLVDWNAIHPEQFTPSNKQERQQVSPRHRCQDIVRWAWSAEAEGVDPIFKSKHMHTHTHSFYFCYNGFDCIRLYGLLQEKPTDPLKEIIYVLVGETTGSVTRARIHKIVSQDVAS